MLGEQFRIINLGLIHTKAYIYILSTNRSKPFYQLCSDLTYDIPHSKQLTIQKENSSSSYSFPSESPWDLVNAFVGIDSRIQCSHVYANVLVHCIVSSPIPSVYLLSFLLSSMEAGLCKNVQPERKKRNGSRKHGNLTL